MLQETWERVRKELRNSIGQHNFSHWIAPLTLREISGSLAVLGVSSAFNGTWVERHFGDKILSSLRANGIEVSGLDFVIDTDACQTPSPETETAVAPLANAAPAGRTTQTAQRGEDDVSAPLDPRFRFESFVVGKPNEMAHAAARRVAEGGPVAYSPLFLYGGVGLGKTHLMHAIAWELKARDPELNILYTSADKFMYRFIQALKQQDMMGFKQIYRNVDVLMVDDIQFFAGKDSTQEEFFHTFNALVEENKQIILSADKAPGAIKDLEERISTRMASGLVVDLHPTTYELRLGILEQKAHFYRERYPGLDIAPGVLEFLAHRISTNVRVLEGALLRLYAFASLVGREIDLELVHNCLADVLKISERKITVEEIQRRVAEHYHIRLSDLIGPKRIRPVARPRQTAMYLCKKLTTRSLPDIGRRFGGRDHTTVMHAIKRIDELMLTDSQLADDVEMLRRSLEA
ncbi:chromosomal replication initiator protein DnaA [Frigidibacter sp. ROC022]|uniref:chromosomal replication initiator protein DnaA n=1 Tax=Frigidibacter sp. ROC022 TaxID=2971796 RepID=UPI00215B3587|nr:chromosomal replication initiator protein DnaA [Frigidibacter sp. ROC022]MCR8724386.1 chromosomal replication initiator protein DnaA [Frigidibacter sp. ROC022]